MKEWTGGPTEFARIVSEWLEEIAPDREPPDLLNRVLQETAAAPRRPAWWRAGGALDILARPRFIATRGIGIAAILVLLGVALVVALGAAGRPQLPLPLGRPGLIVIARDGLLELVDPAKGVVRQVATGEMYGAGAWSRDGSRLAHADGSETNAFLVVSGPDLVEQVRIPLPLGAYPWFSWSPDGRRIAFHTETDVSAQVFVVDVARDARPLAVTDLALHAIGPSWSPDGDWIAVRGGVELDKQALYVMHPDGTGLRRLSQAARAVDPGCGFPWTPDARTVVFETAYNGVWSVDVDGARERMVVGGNEQAYCPSMSPDGEHVAVQVADRSGRYVAIVARNGSTRVVPRVPGLLTDSAVWSPDAQTVAISTSDAMGKQGPIAIFDAAGVEPRQLIPITDGTIVDWQRLPS